MSIRHVVQSALIRQFMLLGGTGWDGKYSVDWIVWEPGGATVPVENLSEHRVTLLPNPADARTARGSEGLCFPLPSAGQVRIGRAIDNDIVIPDATVSRQHLLLDRPASGWTALATPSSRVTKFNVRTAPATDDAPIPLTSSDRITIGGVTLLYLSAAAMRDHVKNEAERASRTSS